MPRTSAPFPMREGGEEEERKGLWPMSAYFIRGTKVNLSKIARAKDLRQEMTPGEIVLWDALRSNRFHGHHFRRQQVIAGFIVDFFCNPAKLVIEVDGEIHNHQIEEDRARDEVLADLGLFVLRVKEEDVLTDIDGVLKRIRERLHFRANAR